VSCSLKKSAYETNSFGLLGNKTKQGLSTFKDENNMSIDVEKTKVPHHSHHHHRKVFMKPTIQIDEDFATDRKATWSELFFDVFFVPVWIALAHRSSPISAEEIFEAFVGFLAVWSCWKNATLYSTRFDTDDIFHRIMLLIQMFAMGKALVRMVIY
jgi:hypothetical protein